MITLLLPLKINFFKPALASIVRQGTVQLSAQRGILAAEFIDNLFKKLSC